MGAIIRLILDREFARLSTLLVVSQTLGDNVLQRQAGDLKCRLT